MINYMVSLIITYKWSLILNSIQFLKDMAHIAVTQILHRDFMQTWFEGHYLTITRYEHVK